MHLKLLQAILVVCGLSPIERMYDEDIVISVLCPKQGHNIFLPLDETTYVLGIITC